MEQIARSPGQASTTWTVAEIEDAIEACVLRPSAIEEAGDILRQNTDPRLRSRAYGMAVASVAIAVVGCPSAIILGFHLDWEPALDIGLMLAVIVVALTLADLAGRGLALWRDRAKWELNRNAGMGTIEMGTGRRARCWDFPLEAVYRVVLIANSEAEELPLDDRRHTMGMELVDASDGSALVLLADYGNRGAAWRDAERVARWLGLESPNDSDNASATALVRRTWDNLASESGEPVPGGGPLVTVVARRADVA